MRRKNIGEKSLKTKRVISILIAAGYLTLVFYLSFQNGPDTAETSSRLTRFLLKLVGQADISRQAFLRVDHVVRILAHIMLFLIYGFLGFFVLSVWNLWKPAGIISMAGIGIFFSVFSEVGKLLIAGRHCSVQDMCLNLLGLTIGLGISLFLVCRKKENKNSKCK